MVAEAAHSWADTANEVFLLIAERSGHRPRDVDHPRGYGRSTYIWSLVAAFGLFSAGAMFSIYHGVSQLSGSSAKGNFTVSYTVQAVAFVSSRSRSYTPRVMSTPVPSLSACISFATSIGRPTRPLRAVFLEDFSALLGLLTPGGAIAAHQVTGNPVFDALGSIGVGVLLAVVAVFLMCRNMQYLLGVELSPVQRSRVLSGLLAHPEIGG
jgi:divalent metal cation (Fe/Co/Zn/Cd) transporter